MDLTLLNSNNNSCRLELVGLYKQCLGRYCGRLILNQSECRYSDCGKCPRGFRPSELGICEECNDDPLFYDYLFLVFILLITIVVNLILIDNTKFLLKISHLNSHKVRLKVVAFYVASILECTIAFLLSLIVFKPYGRLSLKACKQNSLNDWYPVFYNPFKSNGYSRVNCTQEIVYPLYSIVIVFILFSTLITVIVRPLSTKMLFQNHDKSIVNMLNKSIYPILYFYPILVFVQAVAGGILYYSYPILVLIAFLITNVVHLTNEFNEIQDLNNINNDMNSCVSNFRKFVQIVKKPRDLTIIFIHFFLFSFAIVALSKYESITIEILVILLVLVPFPLIFFIISYKFTNPEDFKFQ